MGMGILGLTARPLISKGESAGKTILIGIGDGVPDCVYRLSLEKEVSTYTINYHPRSSVPEVRHIPLCMPVSMRSGPLVEDYNVNIYRKKTLRSIIERKEQVMKILNQRHQRLILVSCLGGAVGSLVTPVVAGYAKHLGIKTTAIITTPFAFEGKQRIELTERAIKKINSYGISTIVAHNNLMDNQLLLSEAIEMSDKILLGKIGGISI